MSVWCSENIRKRPGRLWPRACGRGPPPPGAWSGSDERPALETADPPWPPTEEEDSPFQAVRTLSLTLLPSHRARRPQ